MPKVRDVVGRFALQQELGRGPMSEVFLALENQTGWKVALKFFLIEPGALPHDHDAWAQRMLREARAAAAFQHEAIVRVHEIGERDGEPYLVRDFIEGRSLAEVFADRPGATFASKARWLRALARALADIHRAGLVHRDVKPGNVLVRRDGALRLLDFGVGRRSIDRAIGLGAPAVGGRLRNVGRVRVLGTPAYMAPERFGSQGSSVATDQFGWGVLAYEALAGRLPWGDRVGLVKMIEAILMQKPPSIRKFAPEVPRALDDLVACAMAKVPAARFASMDDLVKAFDEAVP